MALHLSIGHWVLKKIILFKNCILYCLVLLNSILFKLVCFGTVGKLVSSNFPSF